MKCNSQLSQPFDQAYERFSEYSWIHTNDLRYRTQIDMNAVYEADAFANTGLLLRYFMKHFACRIHEAGFQVPAEIPEFLNGAQFLPHVWIGFFKDLDLYRYRSRARADGYDARGGFLGSLMIKLDPEDSKAVFLATEHVVGTIGALFIWDAHVEADPGMYYADRVELYRRIDLPLLEMRADWPGEIFDEREDQWMNI